VVEPKRSPLDGGSRDLCHLEGVGVRATLRQWQRPARALPGGGGAAWEGGWGIIPAGISGEEVCWGGCPQWSAGHAI